MKWGIIGFMEFWVITKGFTLGWMKALTTIMNQEVPISQNQFYMSIYLAIKSLANGP
jgi:hypothetical protein